QDERLDAAGDQENHRGDEISQPQLLVIDGRERAPERMWRFPQVGQSSRDCGGAHLCCCAAVALQLRDSNPDTCHLALQSCNYYRAGRWYRGGVSCCCLSRGCSSFGGRHSPPVKSWQTLSAAGRDRNRGRWIATPAEAVRGSFADIDDQRRTEASEAGAFRPTHARINHTERAHRLQPLGEELGLDVAVSVETTAEGALAPQIVELSAEIGEIVVEGHFILEAADLGEVDALVESDLGLGGLQLEGRVPGTAFRTVEASAERMSMRERRID